MKIAMRMGSHGDQFFFAVDETVLYLELRTLSVERGPLQFAIFTVVLFLTQQMGDVCNVCMWVLEQAVIFEPAPHPALSTLIKLFPESSLPHVIREGLCYGVAGIF